MVIRRVLLVYESAVRKLGLLTNSMRDQCTIKSMLAGSFRQEPSDVLFVTCKQTHPKWQLRR